MTGLAVLTEDKAAVAPTIAAARVRARDIRSDGEPFAWLLGGSLIAGCAMIVGLLALVLWNGLVTFWPSPIVQVTDRTGQLWAGEITRSELYKPDALTLAPEIQATIAVDEGFASRSLFRIGNYDLYGDDFKWISDFEVAGRSEPKDLVLIERTEWGPFIGRLTSVAIDGAETDVADVRDSRFGAAHAAARARWDDIRDIEQHQIGAINAAMEETRLRLRLVELNQGRASDAYRAEVAAVDREIKALTERYNTLAAEADAIKAVNDKATVTFADVRGEKKTMPLSAIVRVVPANDLGLFEAIGIYLARWWEFLSDEPREANTEGGVWPALFGTFTMTLLMVIAVAPFGVITALYLREYARQGRFVAFVRICVNNLAGVPSIVYGVFGLGFFAYLVGGSIDDVFFPERLPSPTFGTGGLLWSSLTLALLTVPVVIVATEEALSAVPRSIREGSLACGASKWQTIKYVVLPRAMPGILTGLILAMARGAGEVAPLMLVGVVKLAPALPIDGTFPFIHLERSFMHLGFHIYDVGFQSRNSEAGKPMVFVTTLLLMALVFGMNLTAIAVRNRLKKKFAVGAF